MKRLLKPFFILSFNKLCKIILGLIICLSCNQTLIYDLIIKEGEVYDGTGSEGVIIDIAIKDDFIVKIGYLILSILVVAPLLFFPLMILTTF